MASKREPSPSLRMRKIALVICEGETEVCYINLLKSWYKSPIRIISHIEGTKITPSLVEKRTKELKISQWDKVHTFLMYDMDVQAINEKLRKCKAEMLLSNPCFEIWLLLHAKDQKAAIETDALIKDLKKSAPVWNIGNMDSPALWQDQCSEALRCNGYLSVCDRSHCRATGCAHFWGDPVLGINHWCWGSQGWRLR